MTDDLKRVVDTMRGMIGWGMDRHDLNDKLRELADRIEAAPTQPSALTFHCMCSENADGNIEPCKRHAEWARSYATQPSAAQDDDLTTAYLYGRSSAGKVVIGRNGVEGWLCKDDAEQAIWQAIQNIKFGNLTDDKLIYAELHKMGIALARFAAVPEPGVKS